MKNYLTIFVLCSFACGLSEKPKMTTPVIRYEMVVDSIPNQWLQQPYLTYSETKKDIEKHRKTLAKAYSANQIRLDSVQNAFTKALLFRIFPHWYGTPWSFEGHTDTPHKGEIACGYFVSTTLLDAGLNLNRFRLAQQSPLDEAKMLCLGDTVRSFYRTAQDTNGLVFQKYLKDGLYFVGLASSHVGFLYKQGHQLFFIHSNYTEPGAFVIIQVAKASVFMQFDQYYVVPITHNRALLNHWLTRSKVGLTAEGSTVLQY